MELLQRNPFTTIKANDLDDGEINEQWVDIKGSGFVDVFCPTHKISQYIVGGKGSGKTHLMRYFSYRSQLLRHDSDFLDGIKSDGYFGVYFQASGLNSSRFDKIPEDEAVRSAVFEYSFELWCAGLVLESVEFLCALEAGVIEDEASFCKEVLLLLGVDDENRIKKLDVKSLRHYLVSLSKEVDLKVNNAVFSGISVDILATRGDLIFGIPLLLKKYSSVFENLTFLYIIDELENISEDQQAYFNTLLREKKLPVSFRMGARTHGIKTFLTLGGEEENREGHEFEITRLDNLYSHEKSYEEFAVDLVINRLSKAGFLSIEEDEKVFLKDSEKKKQYLLNFFEEPEIEVKIKNVRGSVGTGLSPIMSSFNSRLKERVSECCSMDISKNITFLSDGIVELAAIHLLCQQWYGHPRSEEELREISERIRDDVNYYNFSEGAVGRISKKIKYYKNNYTASALRSISKNNLEEYLGFEQLLLITKGFPRHILTVLRNIYKIEVFLGSSPFGKGEKITRKSQKMALKESSEWFHNDCVSEGSLGSSVAEALSRLCEILRIEMYADKPVECSASGFSVNEHEISFKSKEILEWAVLTKVLVRSNSRQEKNSQKIISKYHINGLLCPKWGLSLSKRGAISFSSEDFNCIFDPSLKDDFEEFKSRFQKTRNAPFSLKDEGFTVSPINNDQLGLGF